MTKKLDQFFREDIKFLLFDGKVFINGAKKSSLTEYNALASKSDKVSFGTICFLLAGIYAFGLMMRRSNLYSPGLFKI